MIVTTHIPTQKFVWEYGCASLVQMCGCNHNRHLTLAPKG